MPPEAEHKGAANRIAAKKYRRSPCLVWLLASRWSPLYSGQGLGCSLWYSHDQLSVCPLPYQKHWQNQEIPWSRHVREDCPCLCYVAPGPEQRPARWPAWRHGGQATQVPEHHGPFSEFHGTCGHSYTHQGSPDESRNYTGCQLSRGYNITLQAAHPDVRGTKQTCSCMSQTS